jgi:hypothetical protein
MNLNNRENYNQKILDTINYYLSKYPTIRFNQMLYNLKIILENKDLFNEESETTFKRMLKQYDIKTSDIKTYTDNNFDKEKLNKEKIIENTVLVNQIKHENIHNNIDKLPTNNSINLINKKYTDFILNKISSINNSKNDIINNLYNWLEYIYDRYYHTLYFRELLNSNKIDYSINNVQITNKDTYFLYHLNIINNLFNKYVMTVYNLKHKIIDFEFNIEESNEPLSYHGSYNDKKDYILTLNIKCSFKIKENTINNFLLNNGIQKIEDIQKNLKLYNEIIKDSENNELNLLRKNYNQEFKCKAE